MAILQHLGHTFTVRTRLVSRPPARQDQTSSSSPSDPPNFTRPADSTSNAKQWYGSLGRQPGNPAHQVISQHRYIDFLGHHLRTDAGELSQFQRALQAAQIRLDIPTLAIQLELFFDPGFQRAE